MLAVWLKTLALFDAAERRKLAVLFVCSLLVALVQIAGIASVMPFIAALTSPDLIQTQPFLARLYELGGFQSDRSFIIALGVLLFGVLVIGHALDLAYSWMSVRFINLKEYELSTTLLHSYLTQGFEKTASRNTAELSKNILQDVENVLSGIVFSGMGVVNSALSCVLIVGLLLLMDPGVTLSVTGLFFVCYGAIFLVLSPRVRRLGAEVKELYAQMYVNTQQALDGLKEIKANNREAHFVRQYARPRKASAVNFIRFNTLEMIPSQLLEVTAFGSVIAVSLFFLYRAREPGIDYSLIAMFAFAAYRIIPMVKQVFDGMESFAYYRGFIDGIWDDLKRQQAFDRGVRHDPAFERIERIELQDIHYCYASRSEPALNGVNLAIEGTGRLCLIGASGAGKTTTVDIVLGLLAPQQGRVLINGQPVSAHEYAGVRERIGYVPQTPYLLDDTLANNIRFGDESLDLKRLASAYEAAGLTDVFGPFGQAALDSSIGQHGGRLSGGQKQRIAIARALYKRPDVLVLDESTNGLDLATEQQFLGGLDRLQGVAIVFVSHRPSVMRACGHLIVLDKGQVVAQGSYDSLTAPESRYRGLLV